MDLPKHVKMSSKKTMNTSRTSLDLPESRVYFRMRSNKRIRQSRLVISPEEGLIVESPREMDLERAHRLISRKKDWVLETLEGVKIKQLRAQQDVKKFRNSVLILGQEKQVRVKLGQSRDFILETTTRVVVGFERTRVTKSQVAETLKFWLKDKATQYLPLRVRHLNHGRFNLNEVIVKDPKTLWGSCSADGTIHLNWRLVMAPKFVADYIVYHEMCHTRCMNHSKRFWELVREVCPKFEDAEAWIREYGFLLNVEFLSEMMV